VQKLIAGYSYNFEVTQLKSRKVRSGPMLAVYNTFFVLLGVFAHKTIKGEHYIVI